MRVIVTGSRNWPEREAVWQILSIVATEHCEGHKRLTVAHGDSGNADLAAHAWCVRNPQPRKGLWVAEEAHRPDWNDGKGAGLARNCRLVGDTADLCVAFLMPCAKPGCKDLMPHYSHGASHCADYAERMGIETWRYNT